MKFAPYRNGDYDIFFERYIKEVVLPRTQQKNDDHLLYCTGVTGSGKTSLMFHGYELYDENASIDYIALKRENMADALKRAKKNKSKRFVGYDEANVSKRDSLTKWNKDLIDLLFAIRGLNIFQWYNNPSIDMVDKVLVQEKINGLIFVATKTNDRPRLYYFFNKQDLLDMFEKHDRLTIDLLKNEGKKFCSYIGWFKQYKGKLWEEYEKIKENRMESKIDDFFDKWGSKDGSNDYMTIKDVADKICMSTSAIRNNHDKLIALGLLVEGRDFVINPAGYRLYNDSAPEIFKLHSQSYYNKRKPKVNNKDNLKPVRFTNIDTVGGKYV